MVYMADAARFTDCRSNQSYPIVMAQDYARLERAYLENVATPGGRLYVTFEGSSAQRPKLDGRGTEASVVVEEFINTWPNQSCERSRADASLGNTYWRIVQLQGHPVVAEGARREPHIILRDTAQQRSVAATAGCNQMMGSYAVNGAAITFGAIAGTKMACDPPLMAQERRLTEVLAGARSWRVLGQTLELRDTAGARSALFEAVYLR